MSKYSTLPKGQDKIIRFVTTDATLKHVNQRYEGKDDDRRLALDMKFNAHVDGSFLKDLAASDDVPQLWDAENKLRYKGFGTFESRIELPGSELEFGDLIMSKLHLKDVKVKAFKFQPTDGRALKMVFTAQVHPTNEELIAITHAAHKTAELVVNCNLGPIGATVGDGDENQNPLFGDDDEDHPYPGLSTAH